MSFRSLLGAVLLLGPLWVVPGVLAQPSPPPSPLPSVNQLRDKFVKGCLSKRNDVQQRSYCGCAFNALMRRYDVPQYVAMDTLIIQGVPAVSQFALVAWEPEFKGCRLNNSPALQR